MAGYNKCWLCDNVMKELVGDSGPDLDTNKSDDSDHVVSH
jgi:hypothetical protein